MTPEQQASLAQRWLIVRELAGIAALLAGAGAAVAFFIVGDVRLGAASALLVWAGYRLSTTKE